MAGETQACKAKRVKKVIEAELDCSSVSESLLPSRVSDRVNRFEYDHHSLPCEGMLGMLKTFCPTITQSKEVAECRSGGIAAHVEFAQFDLLPEK